MKKSTTEQKKSVTPQPDDRFSAIAEGLN